jgi:hypothetical protein
MNDIINENAPESNQDDPLEMTFERLLASSPGGGADEFEMEIEVLCKNIHEREDKYGQPYQEIVIDYVTLGSGKHKTKKTRPSFPDGQLIWEQIDKEPGKQYTVTLTRSSNPKKPFYDWTKIVPKGMASAKPSLIEAVSKEGPGSPEAANDSTFDAGSNEVDTAASG